MRFVRVNSQTPTVTYYVVDLGTGLSPTRRVSAECKSAGDADWLVGLLNAA